MGGVAAIWYFVDKFKSSRSQQATAPISSSQPVASKPISQGTPQRATVFGATQSGRHPFFVSEPLTDLRVAKKRSKKKGLPLFLVIFDEKHPTKSKLYYSLGCFLDYFATKKLVEDHFVAALISVDSSAEVRKLVPENDPLENCLWVVLSPDGEILRREGVYANPDEGLARVRSVIQNIGALQAYEN